MEEYTTVVHLWGGVGQEPADLSACLCTASPGMLTLYQTHLHHWIYRRGMDIQTWYGYTDVVWIYRRGMDIQRWYGYTDVVWIYRGGMDIQTWYRYGIDDTCYHIRKAYLSPVGNLK